MDHQHDVTVVVPVHNEVTVLATVLTELIAAFPVVVVVDDGSSDGSAQAARACGALVVEHPVNLGQGAALQTGLTLALRLPSTQYVVTFDADGQHRVDDALAMVERLRAEDVEVIFGSRFLDNRTRPGLVKRMVLRSAVEYSRISTGVRLTDTHNGLRAFTRRGAEAIEIRQNRMAHASEIIEQVGRSGLPWAEQPVHVLYTDYSRAKGQSVLNAVNILAELVYR